MSYVRFVDDHENGRLTKFRERLSAEVRLQTGDEDFPIFQDREDIRWGQTWKERIDDSLDEVTFFIPILTPGFFKSQPCRAELERFLIREEELGRNDLVLPVHYVESHLASREEKGDSLARTLNARQHADWRELRFEPWTSPQVGKALARLAEQIRDALDRLQSATAVDRKAASRPARKPSDSDKRQAEEGAANTGPSVEASGKPAPINEPPIRIVDQLHRGHHTTISEAIKAANPGDRILVRSGLYREEIVIDKPLEIVGDGALHEIIVQAKGKRVLTFNTTMGRVANLTLRQMGGGNYFAVDIAQGRLELEGCDITSRGIACVAIHGSADPRLRGNLIHDSQDNGVRVYGNGQGILEDNDIFGHRLAAVEIKENANPVLRRNSIHSGQGNGVYVFNDGQGLLEDNDIYGNGACGVAIKDGATPTLRRNRIHDSRNSGVFVYQKGHGLLEDNDIFGNGTAGVEIREGGRPTLRDNRINKNKYRALWIYKQGGGVIEGNDLRDNTGGAWNIDQHSRANVTRRDNQE